MKNETNIHTQTTIDKAWNSAKGKFDFSFGFAFQNKQQYLDFRFLWKQNYVALSDTIRVRKESIKSAMRRNEYAGKLQVEAHQLATQATVELIMLSAAKREACRQYLAAKQMTP